MANSEEPEQTAPIVCSGSTLFASILNSSVMLSNCLQQTTSADDIFRCIFFLGSLRVNACMLGTVHDFCLLLKMNFVKNSFRNSNRVSNNLNPNQARQKVGPDLDPNCLQRLSADNTSRQRVKY